MEGKESQKTGLREHPALKKGIAISLSLESRGFNSRDGKGFRDSLPITIKENQSHFWG